MSIVKIKPTSFDKDRFEAHIFRLEERNQNLTDSISSLESRCVKLQREKEDARIKALQGVSAFMSHMYSSLGDIQSQLLKHITQVTNELNSEHSKKAAELLAQVNMMLLPLNNTEDEEES
jgi:hypothetical protein